jgi:hypothetical protein
MNPYGAWVFAEQAADKIAEWLKAHPGN